MNGKSKAHRGLAASLLLASLSMAPALAATPTARVLTGPTSLQWLVEGGDPAGIVLTVAEPDGAVTRLELAEGQTPTFEILDERGNPRPDGVYAYELQLVPKADVRPRPAPEGLGAPQRTEARGPARGTVLSGYFRIENGAVVPFGLPEDRPRATSAASEASGSGLVSATAPDQVVDDDHIVTGSACVGISCADGENFGFATLRLKDQVVRLDLMDTSGTFFPANDWQITVNDTGSGGADRFSIDDLTAAKVPFTLQAGAPDHSLYVAASGRVGLGTLTPVADLHMVRSNTPMLRLEQDVSGGFTAQTWDIAGNEANFFVRDVTGGSRLPFRIRPGAPTSSVDVSSSGKVGFGTTSPEAAIDARGNGETSFWGTTFSDSEATQMVNRRARGTFAAPAAIQSNDALGSYSFRGHNGTDFTSSKAQIAVAAEQGWTATANGTRMTFSTTQNGTTALQTRMTIKNDGRVGIGTTTPAGLLDVNGSIFQRGGILHADYVFDPDYELLSIEENAALMWKSRHLPAMQPRTVDAEGREVIELGESRRGMLEELEKAHIYISQLDGELKAKDEEIAQLAERLARIEALLLENRR